MTVMSTPPASAWRRGGPARFMTAGRRLRRGDEGVVPDINAASAAGDALPLARATATPGKLAVRLDTTPWTCSWLA